MQATQEQWLAFGVLAGALALFASGRLRHDIVAMITLGAVALLGLVPLDEIFDGFGHPAVITVAAVLIISAALNRAGVVDLLAKRLDRYTEHQTTHILLLCAVAAVLSAFINNVGALALLMPVALATAQARGRNPAILLMPLAFAAILGGMCTLIGTPPNIIIATIRAQRDGAAFAMFDFTPVGLTVAAVGVAFVALIGWRLLPKKRRAADAQKAIFDIGGYLVELRVGEDNPLAGRPLREATAFAEAGARVLAVIRGESRLPAIGHRILAKGDVLLVRAPSEGLSELVSETQLEVASEARDRALAADRELEWEDVSLLEAVIAPTSPLIGRPARVLDRLFGGAASLMALARQGAPIRGRLREQNFESGDVMLLQGEAETLREITERFQLWPLAERGLKLGGGDRPLLSLLIFALAIAMAVSGATSIGVAFMIAVVLYAALGVLPLRELYDGVDWPVIVLLGAMFPLGAALEETRATQLLAGGVVDGAATVGFAPWMVMALVLIVTMFLSDVINNAATALLMAPLSMQIADALSANHDPFLMAVAVGASCAFLTPIGHQCNTLVMAPGGYKFSDYWRMGLPLEVVIVLVSVPMILWVWPL